MSASTSNLHKKEVTRPSSLSKQTDETETKKAVLPKSIVDQKIQTPIIRSSKYASVPSKINTALKPTISTDTTSATLLST